jgi:hypothetical protein
MGTGTEREDGEQAVRERLALDEVGFSIAPVSPAKATSNGLVKKPRGKAVKLVKPAQTEITPIGKVPRKLLIPGTLDHAFHFVGGREVAISLTRLGAYAHPDFTEFLRIYDELTPVEQGELGLLERLCLAVGIHPSNYFGRLCALAYKRNFDVAHFAAAASAPLVVEKVAKYAQAKDGFRHAQLLLQVTGHATRGPLVQVNQNSDNRSVSVTSQGPSFEELTAKVSELIRGGETVDGAIIETREIEE